MINKKLTLDECIAMIRQEEEVHIQQGVMRGKMETAVSYVSSVKVKAKHQSTPVPRMQPKEQH